jgi:hypothetical protein
MLFTLNSCSQVDNNKLLDTGPEKSISIHTDFEDILEEFVAEAKERGFYVRGYMMKRIDYIYYYNEDESTLDDDILGITVDDYRGIYINSKLMEQRFLLKIVIFHEIGHALTRTAEHKCYHCGNIMSENALYDLSYYGKDNNWEKALDIYFEWLNKR